ncbi:MAG: FtsX-like permease family protein [Woeseia sp.]|nr:FtsX-like permease family protein [Woeseia sp.]MBT6210439.1 FtsX-like permease family protein [Woeseia sp.]
MKAVLYAIRTFGREIRSGEVVVLLAAVALAVAALTAVGFLTDRIGRAVERQANEVLAADLRLRTPDPIPAAWHATASDHGLRSAETQTFPSVVFAGDFSSLATIKGVTEGYPLRGNVRIASQLFGEQRVAEGVPASGTIWADGALMARLDVAVGDRVSIGEAEMVIDAVLMYRPDQSIGFASLAPSLVINALDLPATALINEGSRVSYALLVAGDTNAVDDFYEEIEVLLPESVRSRNREEGSDRASNAADRAQRFLSLTAVISLLLSAVAIAMSARRFAHRRMDTVALMKSLGASQQFVISAAFVQLVLLGILGVLLGSVMGFVVEALVTNMLADVIQGDLPPAGFTPVFLACGSALILLIGFALPSLLQLRDTPPLRVLRHDEMPPAPSRLLVVGTSLLAVAVMLYQAIGDGLMLLIVLGGMLVVSAVLYVAGRGLVILMGRSRGGVGIAWRYGLANVARRGRDSAIQVVAFGLGLTVLLLLTFVRTDLLEEWQQTLDANAPNHFLINIQPQERSSIEAIFAANGVAVPNFVPMVRARMKTINGADVKEREYPEEGGKWMANREQNLTWATHISESNELVDGEWWPADYVGDPLVSLEEDAARELGVELGDRLSFIIAGREIEAKVASTRKVNWDSFQPNFFLVMSPGSLDNYPSTFISGARIAEEGKRTLVELVRSHPTVSVIDIDAILVQITGILDKVSLAVQAVFVFTLAAGIAVLFAAVQSTIDERRFESAMLRALGVRRRTVLSGVLTEFVALGFAAGLLAAAGASILAAIVTIQLFELDYAFNPLLWLAGLLGGIALVCVSGFIAARGAINAPPVDVLRAA